MSVERRSGNHVHVKTAGVNLDHAHKLAISAHFVRLIGLAKTFNLKLVSSC